VADQRSADAFLLAQRSMRVTIKESQ